MPRRQRSSPSIRVAEIRATGLQAIDPYLDLGNGHTLAAFQEQIQEAKKALNEYNLTLSRCDTEQARLEALEKKLADLASTYLKAVAVKYGSDSIAYQKAGGRRRSERRRPSRKTPEDAAPTTSVPVAQTQPPPA